MNGLRSLAAGDQGALHGLYERATAEEVTLDVFYDV